MDARQKALFLFFLCLISSHLIIVDLFGDFSSCSDSVTRCFPAVIDLSLTSREQGHPSQPPHRFQRFLLSTQLQLSQSLSPRLHLANTHPKRIVPYLICVYLPGLLHRLASLNFTEEEEETRLSNKNERKNKDEKQDFPQ